MLLHMRQFFSFFAPLCLLVVFFPLFTAAAAVIDAIVINGNKRVEASTIRSYVDFVEGENFEQDKINSTLKKIFATGLFADVNMTRDANNLIITVVENPAVNKVVFEGNKRINDEDLANEISLHSRSIYTKAKVQNDVRRIIDLYNKSGRYSVSVVPKAIQLDFNRINLVFEIDEGKKSVIENISFIGNDSFSNSDLRDVISSKKSTWWNFFSNNDVYDQDRIEYDKELLRKFYLSKGYADFKATSSIAELTTDRSSFILTFTIEEGNKYNFGKVDLTSTLSHLDPELLQSKIATKSGARFNAELIEKTVQDITSELNNFGYAFVDVNTLYARHPEERTVDLSYQIKEGPKVYINNINISGNVRTLDKVIRREFRISEGDPFNAAKIRRSKQRIENLGFFEKTEVEVEKSDVADKVDIDVNVAEKSTGELNFGAGFSTSEGALGTVSIRERNLLGKGQDLKVNFQLSGRGNQISLGFTEPYFLGKDIAAGFDIYNIVRDYESESGFNSETQGGVVRGTYSLTEHLRHTLKYSFNSVDITDIEADASTYIRRQEGKNTTSLVGHSLLYDRRNNKFFPTEGYYILFNQDFAGLGGDSKFYRNELRSAYYHPIFRDDIVFSIIGKGGFMDGYGDKDVRINERFFIGGSTIRGFEDSGIGPRDESTTDALGGNAYYAGTLELSFPLGLPDELGFRGSIFTDAGSLFEVDDTGIGVLDESSIRASAGAGVSWRSPLGPIQLDFAYAFAKEDFDKTENFRVNFGTRF